MTWHFVRRADGAFIMAGEPPAYEKFAQELVAGDSVRASLDGLIFTIAADNAVVRYKITERSGDWYHGRLVFWRDRQEVTGPGSVGKQWVDGIIRFQEE